MPETLRELNEQAIKDGLLLPDGQSHRKDFTPMLGKRLSCRELRELNEQAIKDGLLLPDGQSHRKDFTPMLGKRLSCREQKVYSLIHGHSEPTTVEELAKELYPDYFKINLGHHAIENIHNLVSLCLKKKLGETAIISRRKSGYLSRRSLIVLDVEENMK